MIYFLISASDESGIAECGRRGWVRIARSRFVTPDKHDVRVISRFTELIPMPGTTRLIKGADYEDGPDSAPLLARWIGWENIKGEKEQFDAFVASGQGEWTPAGAGAP